MTGKQSAVLWLGLLLVVLRSFSAGQWQLIWKTISTVAPAKPANTASHSSSETGATGSVTLLA